MHQNKLIIGVTGGIAAYKSCELVRRAQDAGFEVRVVMTHAAQSFVTPLTFQALSGNPVHTDLLDERAEAGMGHIELARWADTIVVAPATANFIAGLASGEAGDLLSTLCIASRAPLYVAPAMNQAMWSNARTQTNIEKLRQIGINVLSPGVGEQACGDVGPGRMMEPGEILEQLQGVQPPLPLSGKKILITGGPTREAIDPVRFISNHSSGKMAFALAGAACRMGAKVTLVSGPVALETPRGVERVFVEDAAQMLSAVMERVADADLFIGAAAVSDYRPSEPANQKIKKSSETLNIKLTRNPDILSEVAALKGAPYCVGFAAESENLLQNAREKLRKKAVDLIVANDISRADVGFDSDENECWVIGVNMEHKIDQSPKPLVAESILDIVAKELASRK